jgi:hypothetical protein
MSFAEHLKATLANKPSPAPAYQKARDKLDEVIQGLQDVFDPNKAKVSFFAETGYQTNWGEQVNIIMAKQNHVFREVLFRVYIPENGFPVRADLDGEQPLVLMDETALERDLAEKFGQSILPVRIRDLLRA